MRPFVTLALLALAGIAPASLVAQQSPHGTLPEGVDCGDCHTAKSWKPDPATITFDHSRQTDFRLEGRHRSVACRSCHLDLTFADPVLRNAECGTCHGLPPASPHPSSGSCDQCHGMVVDRVHVARVTHVGAVRHPDDRQRATP